MMQERWVKHFMAVAYQVADLSYSMKKKVGAVAVKDRRIICTGYNGTLPGQDNACETLVDGQLKTLDTVEHAERNLIAHAARHGIALFDSVLFVTHSPCIPCARMIANAGVKAVYWGNKHDENEGITFLNALGVHTYEYSGPRWFYR